MGTANFPPPPPSPRPNLAGDVLFRTDIARANASNVDSFHRSDLRLIIGRQIARLTNNASNFSDLSSSSRRENTELLFLFFFFLNSPANLARKNFFLFLLEKFKLLCFRHKKRKIYIFLREINSGCSCAFKIFIFETIGCSFFKKGILQTLCLCMKINCLYAVLKG